MPVRRQFERAATREGNIVMSLTRRSLLAATAGASLAARAARAQTAEFNYKLAHNQPTTSPLHIRYAEAAERVRAETGGRLNIQVFPNSQLGSDTDTLAQLRSGAV